MYKTILTAAASVAIWISTGPMALAANQGTTAKPAAETALTVGVLRLADTVPLQIAITDGLFKQRGLKVTTVPAPGGAAATAGLLSGQMQIAFGTYVPFILAASKGAPLKIASPTQMTRGVPSALAVRKDSRFKATGDLKGAKIAVSSLTNTGTMAIRRHLQAAGVDPSSAQYVTVPFPNMVASLEHGQVDAAWLVEPFLTEAESQDAIRVLFNPFAAPMPSVPFGGYMTTEKYLQSNPDVVTKFNDALQEAGRKINADQTIVRHILPSYTKISENIASKIRLSTLSPDAPESAMQSLSDMMEEDGLLDGHFDVKKLYR